MDNYEKKADKVFNTVEKVAGVANRVYNGCALILVNLLLGGFCLWGVYMAYNSWQLEQSGVVAVGEVVRLEESKSPEGGCCVYSPVIEFVVQGQTYSIEGDTASDPPAYALGDEVKVLYDPADPATAQINQWSERWLVPLILIPTMLLGLLIANFFLIRALWRNDILWG